MKATIVLQHSQYDPIFISLLELTPPLPKTNALVLVAENGEFQDIMIHIDNGRLLLETVNVIGDEKLIVLADLEN